MPLTAVWRSRLRPGGVLGRPLPLMLPPPFPWSLSPGSSSGCPSPPPPPPCGGVFFGGLEVVAGMKESKLGTAGGSDVVGRGSLELSGRLAPSDAGGPSAASCSRCAFCFSAPFASAISMTFLISG
ncbi:hypothetical protein GE09DRAFT_1160611 [Coniochaeta sp. 2T2.1]|nr:hypothetical protein GE09DRAFT_1160611 [Coniochaeta sp. 2T2.1]